MRRVLLALTFVLGTPAWGLDPKVAITQYGHEVWTTADGLPHNSIRAIAQTPDGYLWVATSGRPGAIRWGWLYRVHSGELAGPDG